ncbi:MAG: sigma-54-dependent Fis family transcriptional regulator [Chthoniobacterales bacterium]|nr:sigma-54-dependent Fis family transcriptional regulator [Chthoniobacterales bacterium]
MAKILIVDDDAAFAEGLAETLSDLSHSPALAESGERALVLLQGDDCGGFDLVFLDLRMRGMDGLETLRRIKEKPECAELPVVMLTAHADGANTIEAMKLGAFDHLTKPIGREDVRAVLGRALSRPRAGKRAPAAGLRPNDDRLIGSSAAMREVQKLIGLAAGGDVTVLIQGETGTGKEEVAHALHRHGPRAGKPFVAVNCAAIPAELLESELFGHVRGAFTGAMRDRVGRFREANNGTLFLDEIGDMTPAMQAKILRVLQDRLITPIGSSTSQRVDVRIIAATHRDLIAMVKEGAFREDLFYRLNVLRISLPPLRERGADILVLAEHFLRELAPENPKRLTPAAAEALLANSWPGNVRELRNLLQQATLTVRKSVIDRADLPLGLASSPPPETIEALLLLPFSEATSRLEKLLLERALCEADGNRAEAARRLGIHRQFLYAKLKEHGLGDKPSSEI